MSDKNEQPNRVDNIYPSIEPELSYEQISRNTIAYKHCLEDMPGVLHEWAERTGRTNGAAAAAEAVAVCNEVIRLDATAPIYPSEITRK
jgi:hypothetical protein